MDARRFDALTRTLTTALTRRQGLRAALVAIAGGALTVDPANAAVRRRTCRALAASCLRNSDCCSGTCETRRSVPRRERNRCVCIPDCDGKTCGPDGCGGSCGDAFPLQCGADGVAYSVCEDFTPTLGAYNDAIWCEGSVEGTTDGARAAWYPWGEDPCTSSAECQLLPVCERDGYGCMCEATWTNWETGEPGWDADGGAWCLLYRSAPNPCLAGYDGKEGCSATIEGDLFGTWGWAQDPSVYSGYSERCTSSAECVAKDARCNDEDKQCVCELGWGWFDTSWEVYDNAYCSLFWTEY
jgi:hypothetical protein